MQIGTNTARSLGFAQQRLRDYALLSKFRLSTIVVLSAVAGYAIAMGGSPDWMGMLWLGLGGFLVTASSNTLNQIFERDYDKLMKRTANRPLAANRMGNPEAMLVAGVTGFAGILILWNYFNPVSALLGALSLILYAFVYTPLKRISPVAVFVGAIPGAIPPLIGWVAVTGQLGIEALALFSIQFIWQFPHFWAIGWIAYDDYNKAGYKLLPTKVGKDKTTALFSLIYTMVLIPMALIPVILGTVALWAGIVAALAAVAFTYFAVKLYRSCSDKDARKLMFASIIYLPVVLLVYVVGTL